MVPTAVASVLTAVDELTRPMLGLLTEVVAIPSVGGTDAENDGQAHMAGVFAGGGLEVDHWRLPLAELTAHPAFPGMEVERSEAWGLVGRLPGTGAGAGPTLMFNGHIDVVPPGDRGQWTDDPYSGTVRVGKLYGRGSCDMKAGLVAAHWAVQAIRRSGIRLRGDVLVASVQGEEDGGLGTFATLERGWRADACVLPEPTDLDLIPANAGALTFRLRIRGLATHASRRLEGVSAIEKFWPVWRALQELEARRHVDIDPASRGKWGLTHPLSIGTVQAGDWASSVPDLLVAEGRMGVALDEPVAEARAALETAVAEACAADAWLRVHPVEVEWWGGQFASGRLPAESDLLDRTRAAHSLVTGGGGQEVFTAPYGSDLRLLVGHGGIPTLHYGPGDVALAHGPDESVAIADVVTTARALAALAIDVCGVA